MTENGSVKVVECPRDAMQGWKHFIPTDRKIGYLNSLLRVGFDTLDFGSFVSPKAIPQLADTHGVLKKLDLTDSATKLLAIVANERGAAEATAYDAITYLGFPLSISETFQQRNTNGSIADGLNRISAIQELCDKTGKTLVVYISMAFGNPYGNAYHPELVFQCADDLVKRGIPIISLADTVGIATPQQVKDVTAYLVKQLPQTEIGVHLHASAQGAEAKIDAAYTAGCRRFDGALNGIGGCPMAHDEFVGNMATEWLLRYFKDHGNAPTYDEKALQQSLQLAAEIFV